MTLILPLQSPASSVKAQRCQVGSSQRVTAKGYGTLLSYAEADENTTILERFKDSKTVRRQRYDMKCRRDLFNKYTRITVQLAHAAEAEKNSAHTKRRRICTAFSSTTGCSSTSSRSVQLLYKNVCILCNEPAHLFRSNPEIARKRYRFPDNLTADGLKYSLLKTAVGRLGC